MLKNCVYVCNMYLCRNKTHRRRHGRRGGRDTAGGFALPRSEPLLWSSTRHLPSVPEERARHLRCPEFCPAAAYECYYVMFGRRMADQLRNDISIEWPVPLTELPVAPRPQNRPINGGNDGNNDSQRRQSEETRRRLNVLRDVESRLRAIRREVDIGWQALMPTADQRGAPNVIDRVREQEAASPQGERTVTTSTVPHIEAVPLSPYPPADLRDDDDNSSSSEAADIELWMTAGRLTPERPDEER